LMTASAPTISCRYDVAADCSFGLASRLKAVAKFAAVTGWPVLKRNVRFSWIVCVFPSFDTFGKPFATSGSAIAPAGAGLSGYV
jgi:hypothetical protein